VKVCNKGHKLTLKNVEAGQQSDVEMFPAYLPPLTYAQSHQTHTNWAKYLRIRVIT